MLTPIYNALVDVLLTLTISFTLAGLFGLWLAVRGKKRRERI